MRLAIPLLNFSLVEIILSVVFLYRLNSVRFKFDFKIVSVLKQNFLLIATRIVDRIQLSRLPYSRKKQITLGISRASRDASRDARMVEFNSVSITDPKH